MKLSIVSTLFHSSPYIKEFYCRVTAAAQGIFGNDYEIILVNDGSPDNSLEIAVKISRQDERVVVIDLSRNFGHHPAIIAGLTYSIGDLVLLIDCDLEEQPEWLSILLSTMEQSNADVVFGVQEKRISSRFSNLLGELFWYFLNVMSTVDIPHNPMTCRLMSRRYVNSLLNVGDRVLYLAGTFAWTGFVQKSVCLRKISRPKGHQSTYSFIRKFAQVADSFTSFSVVPLSIIFFIGLTIWIGSILLAFSLLLKKILNPEMILSGFVSIMLSIWFLGGTIILLLGVIGLYIAKTFQETKQRPLYVVRARYGRENHEQPT